MTEYEKKATHHREVSKRIAIDQTEAEKRFISPRVKDDEPISFNVTLKKKNYRELKECAGELNESRSGAIYKAISFLHEKLFGSRLPFTDGSGANGVKPQGEEGGPREETQGPEATAAQAQAGEPKGKEEVDFDGMAGRFLAAYPGRKCNPAYVAKWFRERAVNEEDLKNMMAILEREKEGSSNPFNDPGQCSGPVYWLDQHFKDDADEPDF